MAAVVGLLAAGDATAALVRTGTLVVRADGGFTPRLLPRRAYAPISFQGHVDIESTGSAPPPALQSARIDFDRDGRLTTAGLPVCLPTSIQGTSPAEARQRCRAAIVGSGHVRALVTLPGRGPVEVSSPLTLFNGPRQGGDPTIVAHAQTTYPSPETYVVVVPIERRHGAYSYRATFEVPTIAGGYGTLTHVDLKIGRRYRAGGVERSYVSARCSDNVLETRGRFGFADGTIVAGTVFKACNARA
ncbi:MAG TPA: hypothetical protein VF770_03410 [Solirubrobacterales bacterium]